jgi:hypothetical protein
MIRDALFANEAAALGYSFDGEIKIGGNYALLLQDGNHISVGVFQLPKNATVEIDFIVTVD